MKQKQENLELFELRKNKVSLVTELHEDLWTFCRAILFQIKDLRKSFLTVYHMRDSNK